MDLKFLFGISLFSIAIFAIAMLLPEGKTSNSQNLPWQIEQTEGSTRVFGLTLGVSRLREAERLLQGDGEISLFRSENGAYSIESYFDKTELGGLTAKMVLVMDIPAEELAQIYERGVRVSKLGNGTSKVSIATADLHRTRSAAIASITYLPAINLTAEQLKARFGAPAQRIREPDSSAEHWLYPAIGLDITLDENAKEVFQYIKPSSFTQISQPLLNVK